VKRYIVVLAPNGKYPAQCTGPFLSYDKAQGIAAQLRHTLLGSDIYVSPLLPASRWDDLGET
jgi:hypothetical protein